MKKVLKHQKLRPQLERFFQMLWSRGNIDMWAFAEKLILKKISPSEAIRILFRGEKHERNILQFFTLLHNSRSELAWLVKDVYVHDLEPTKAIDEVLDYLKVFGK